MFEKALRDILTHERHIRRIVDDKGDQKVFPVGELPQNTRPPYVTYEAVNEAGDARHQDGTNLSCDAVQVTCWADDYSTAVELRDWVRGALLRKRGTFDGEEILGIFRDNRRSETEETPDKSEHPFHAAATTFIIWHREA